VFLIEEPMAAAIGAGLPVTEPVGLAWWSISAAARRKWRCISLGGIVYARSVRVGGDKMDEAIISYIRRNHNLLIGEASAERIKMEIGAAAPPTTTRKARCARSKGRDLMNGVPREVLVSQRADRREPGRAGGGDRRGGEGRAGEHAAGIGRRHRGQGHRADRGGALLFRLDQVLRDATGLPVVDRRRTRCSAWRLARGGRSRR
jgi:rod shape-determining protein MreB